MSELTVPKSLLKSPGGFNPTVAMFATAIALLALTSCGYWLWDWSGWVCFGGNVLALHLAGTVIHDASHRAAHRNHAINTIMGHGSALMLGFVFPVFTRVHRQHHAHVNDPENDPDHFVSTGGPLLLVPVRFFYHEVFFFRRRLWQHYELLEWIASRAALAALVALAWNYGFVEYLLNYWFCASLVVGWALGLFFDYLPHRPFQHRQRWKNARVYPSTLLNLLILGQNYHLIHHLWPSIPWYKYQQAYRHAQPLLEAQGSPQTLGLLAGRDFRSFVYDIFIGIRRGRRADAPVSE